MIIKVFNTFEDVLMFIEDQEYHAEGFFKAEILRTDDGRFRVGVLTNPQLELNI